MTTQANLKSRIARLLDRSIARSTSRTNLIRTAVAFALILAAVGTVGLRRSIAQDTPERVYKVGNGVTSPKVLYKVDPQYSEEARKAKVEGTVLLNLVIQPDGMAHDISVVTGPGYGLDLMAMQAVAQWRFQPGTLDSQPVAVRARIEVNFKLVDKDLL